MCDCFTWKTFPGTQDYFTCGLHERLRLKAPRALSSTLTDLLKENAKSDTEQNDRSANATEYAERCIATGADSHRIVWATLAP